MQTDLDTLSKYYDVRSEVLDFNIRDQKAFLSSMARLAKGILWCDLSLAWFGGAPAYWSARLAKLFGKRSAVVLGGYEVANIPELNYGSLANSTSASKISYILHNADLVLPVDESLRTKAIENFDIDGSKVIPIPTGYNSDLFKPNDAPKENLVLTVAYITKTTIRLKGLDTFVGAARMIDDVNFAIAGPDFDGSGHEFLRSMPDNVELLGYVPRSELTKHYGRAKVYCQLSMSEGLPNALCEAMLCECVPVATRVGGIPSAMDDIGFYVSQGDPRETASAILKALQSDQGQEARKRIMELFTQEERENRLHAAIESVLR